MAFNQCVYLRYFHFPSVEHASWQTYQRNRSVSSVSATVRVADVHPALMYAKLSFPDKHYFHWTSDWCKFARLCRHRWRYFVQSWEKSNTCTQPRARAHNCHEYSQKGNLSTNTTKMHSLFERISSWWLLNQENAHARVCDMENFYAMPMHLFFNHWIWAWRAFAFVQFCKGLAAPNWRRFLPKQMTTCNFPGEVWTPCPPPPPLCLRPYQSIKQFEFILSLQSPRKKCIWKCRLLNWRRFIPKQMTTCNFPGEVWIPCPPSPLSPSISEFQTVWIYFIP